jgi:hypothetical protein
LAPWHLLTVSSRSGPILTEIGKKWSTAAIKKSTPLVKVGPVPFQYPSPNILEKGAGDDRQAELDAQDNEQDARETSPDAHLDELA